MVGMDVLEGDGPGPVSPPRAPRARREELESLSRGAEVREIQERVRRQDSDRRDPGKVVALGDHLRPDQALRPPRDDFLQHSPRAAAARRVAVEDDRGDAGEELREPFGHALRARADRLEHGAAAVGAPQGPRSPLAAVMADEGPPLLMDGAAHAAPAAPKIVATLPAEEKRGEAAARLEQDRLLAPRK